jgi:hypothetical protein
VNQALRNKLIILQSYQAKYSIWCVKLFFSDKIFLTQKQQLEVLQFFQQEFTKLFLLSHLIFFTQGL